jgi:hypothetical protein
MYLAAACVTALLVVAALEVAAALLVVALGGGAGWLAQPAAAVSTTAPNVTRLDTAARRCGSVTSPPDLDTCQIRRRFSH